MNKNYLLFAAKVFLRGLLYSFIMLFVFMAIGILFFLLMRYTSEQIFEIKNQGYPYQQQINIVVSMLYAFIPQYFAFKRTFINDSKKFKIDLLLSIKYSVLLILIVDIVMRIASNMFSFNNIYALILFIASIVVTAVAYYLAGTRAAEKYSKT